MRQSLMPQAAEIVFDKKVELPGKLWLDKREPAGDRLLFISAGSRLLYLCDQIDRAFFVFLTLVRRRLVINPKQRPVAEVFLHNDALLAFNPVDFRHGNPVTKKQPAHVEIGMNVRVEGLGINSSDGLSLFPWNTEITSRRSIGRQRHDQFAGGTLTFEKTQQSLGRGNFKSVHSDLFC